MRSIGVLLALTFVVVVFAGCTEPSRDIDSEAKQREEWARQHNDYRPVAILSGPERLQPGALVWFSAHGSHDPDFFGARDTARREAQQEGGFHAEADASSVQWSWHLHLDDSRNDGLGAGIKEYHWRIDEGPTGVAHELTHRYGSEDGPVRFPVGFTDAGTHTLTLTVVDWNGETDTVTQTLEVTADGTGSTIPGWRATEAGWTHERTVPVAADQYRGCGMMGRSHYDPEVHHLSVPWDLYFFTQELHLEATWDRLDPTDAVPAAMPSGVPLPTVARGPNARDPGMEPALNHNDMGISLGHCEQGEVWSVIDTDQGPLDEPVEEGRVTSEGLAGHAEKTGAKTERQAGWDLNVYLSDRGDVQGGTGGEVLLRLTFAPAEDTRYGGL